MKLDLRRISELLALSGEGSAIDHEQAGVAREF